MGEAAIIALIGFLIQEAPVIAADITALGNLLFHVQAGNVPPIDLEKRAEAIAARKAAIEAANKA